MKVTAKMNPKALSQLSKAHSTALAQTGQQILNDVRNEQTMPFDTGNLQNEQTYVDDSKAAQGTVSVISDTPYARKLYFHPELNFQRGKNPNAGAGWFDPYIHGDKGNKVKEWFRQLVRRNGGGYIR